MSVEFEQEQMLQNRVPSPYGRDGDKGIIGWLLKNKIARNTHQANLILITTSAISIALAILWPILMGTNKSNAVKQIYREDVEQSKVVILPDNRRTEFLQSLPSRK